MADAVTTPDPKAGEPPVVPVVEPPKPEDQLGDAGKRALAEERTARATAEKEAKAAKAELEKLRKASMSENEKAVADAKAEGRKEALSESNVRLLRSEVRAAAAGKLADPSDAPALLGDLDRFLTEAGDVDSKSLSSAIDELVKAKPYLAPAGARPGRLPGGGAKPSEGLSMDDWLRDQAKSKGRT
jgi:hypothetical protein